MKNAQLLKEVKWLQQEIKISQAETDRQKKLMAQQIRSIDKTKLVKNKEVKKPSFFKKLMMLFGNDAR